MNDLSQEISRILSDPGAMEQIKSLSGLFGQSAPPQGQSPPPPPETELPSLSGMAGAADMLPAVMKFMPLLSSLREDDDSIRLLRAVKPFLSAERQERLEQAIRILRVIRLVPLLKDKDLLNLF